MSQTTIPETATAPASPRRLLVDWANGQDGWVRQIVSEVLSAGSDVTDSVLDAVFEQYLTEKNLSKTEPVAVPPLVLDEGTATGAAELVIKKLSAIRGVNALAPDQSIEFNPGVTILFGENAAGKTGYARILKHLAAVRTVEPILPNVHEKTAQFEPEAKVEYEIAGVAATLDWKGEKGVAPFTHVGIFDSGAVQLHVDDDLAYLYTPADLGLFPRVTKAINGVRARLDAAVQARRPSANPYLHHFTRGTAAFNLIETLGPATEADALRELADVKQVEEEQAVVLEASVVALQAEPVPAQLTVARSRCSLHERLLAAAQAVQAFDANPYNEAVANAAQADAEHAKLRADLAGADGDAEKWQNFVLAGEVYRDHLEKHDYPQEGDVCLYCEQPLSAEARALVQRYRDFANDASRRRAEDARQLGQTLGRHLTQTEVAPLQTATAEQLEDEPQDEALEIAGKFVKTLKGQQAAVADCKPAEAEALLELAAQVAELSSARKEAAEQLVSNLTTRADERVEALGKAKSEHAELKDRIELKQRLGEIESYLEDAKWVQRAMQLEARFPQLLRSLTETAKVASERLLNTDFTRRFEDECAALRAPVVKLEFPGREGKAARRKTVSASHKPSAILSEGEQKVIALSDFLAEAALRLTPAPIVFDDPVTSLDYRRIREVADRIAYLAVNRQVVVFTHNIWFATELLSRFEKDRKRCTYYSITDEPTAGTVVAGNHPRWDTVKDTRGKINSMIQAAENTEGEAREAVIERSYGLIRAWCEVVVEVELLAGVTQRYQPNVMMTALDKIKADRLSDAVGVILPIFEKACRIMEGHSQPLETLGVRPTLEELRKDWAELQVARDKYVKD
jgi:ABC-type transport system involved in cytochrome c biogenesis ATPase subunit